MHLSTRRSGRVAFDKAPWAGQRCPCTGGGRLLRLLCAPLVALLLTDCQEVQAVEPTASMAGGVPAEDPTLRTIFARRSVRRFRPDPVAPATLELLVRAGMAAPTAVDKRPWEFVVVTERATLDALAAALPYAKMAAQAPAAIVVAGDLQRQHGGPQAQYWIMDCSAATQNILLAVQALGLGAVWTALYPYEERIAPVRRLLGLPAYVVPLNLIPLGYPADDGRPKDKWDPRRLHRERWQSL